MRGGLYNTIKLFLRNHQIKGGLDTHSQIFKTTYLMTVCIRQKGGHYNKNSVSDWPLIQLLTLNKKGLKQDTRGQPQITSLIITLSPAS